MKGFACLLLVLFSCGLNPASASEIPSAPPSAVAEEIQPGSPGDRALTMLEGLATRTEAFVQKSAPEVWRIHVQQVKYEAATIWIGPLLVVIASLFFFVVCWKVWRHFLKKAEAIDDWRERETSEQVYVGAFVIGAVSLIVLVISSGYLGKSLIDSSEMNNNPEYYALERILNKVK